MRQLLEKLHDLAVDPQFLRFQHAVTQKMYNALGQSYAQGKDEVGTVTELVKAVNGEKYRELQLAAEKIHGTRSYVEFDYRDKPVTTELGDTVVISIVSSGANRLLQRVTIIQNKKSPSGKWKIDPEQLYLLKNFPTLSGEKGIFRNCKDVLFRNDTGCLGCYGLFDSPGEMTLASAPLVCEFLRGKGTLSLGDMQHVAASQSDRNDGSMPLLWLGLPPFRGTILFHILEEWYHHYGGVPPFTHGSILGNTSFCRDVHDFARAWLRFSLGEPTCVAGEVVNRDLDAFSLHILRRCKFSGLQEFGLSSGEGDNFQEYEFDGTLAVLLTHYRIEGE